MSILMSGQLIPAETQSPVKTPARQAHRQRPRGRNFAAAEVSDAYNAWTTASTTPDELIFKSLRILRARSRQLSDSVDMAASYIRLCENHIVGFQGFRFDPRARDLNGELDVKANAALRNAWKEWGDDRHCDFQGKHSEESLDQLALRTVAIDGEAFIEELPGDVYGISYRLHDPETVPVDYHRPRSKTENLIRFGIEYDKHDRPTAYYFRDQNGAVTFFSGYDSRALKLTRIPADRIHHIYVQNKVGLRRGIPWMAPSMVRFRMLGKFEDAAIKNAIIGASKVGIISGEGAVDVVDAIDSEGGRIIDTDFVGLYETDAEVKFSTFDTEFPSNDYVPFIKTNTMFLSAGVGVNYNSMSGDLSGVNYSALKHGTTEERETWKKLQKWFIQEWKRPQYLSWLKMGLLVGIPMDNKTLLRAQDYKKYSVCEFHGRRWQDPDALKKASADAIEMRGNTVSPQMVIRDKGYDPDTVFEEIARFHAKMRELGIPVEVGNNVININTAEQPNTDEN